MAYSMESFTRNLVKSFTTLLDLMIEIINLLSRVTTGGHLLLGVESVGSQQCEENVIAFIV